MIKLAKAETFIVSAIPLSPARSVLGDLTKRSSLLIKVTDHEGAIGWGEIWSNFPPSAAQHRAAMVHDLAFPSIRDTEFETPRDLANALTNRWRILAHHTGETGAFENIQAGIDIAVWDLLSRKKSMSVRELAVLNLENWFPSMPVFEVKASDQVKVYASSPDRKYLEARLEEVEASGHKAVKLKVGYDDDQDVDVMRRAREKVGNDFAIMVDSNQSWSVAQAIEMVGKLDAYDLNFAEEPIPAFLPVSEWARLSAAVRPDIAIGENIRTLSDLIPHIEEKSAQVLQPSVTKFGGVTGWIDLAGAATQAGMRLCPHYMGAAPGLSVTIQLLSLFDGEGPLEVDANDNAIRTDIGDLDLSVTNGTVNVPQGHGIGIELNPENWRELTE